MRCDFFLESMATKKRAKAGKVSQLAAGLGINFNPGAPPPQVEADSEQVSVLMRTIFFAVLMAQFPFHTNIERK